MKYNEKWDLKTIPDPLLNSEFARRRALKKPLKSVDADARARLDKKSAAMRRLRDSRKQIKPGDQTK